MSELVLNLEKALRRKYRLRRNSRPGRVGCVQVVIPREVCERAARQHAISLEQFVEQFIAVWHFDGFEGLYLEFMERAAKASASPGGG